MYDTEEEYSTNLPDLPALAIMWDGVLQLFPAIFGGLVLKLHRCTLCSKIQLFVLISHHLSGFVTRPLLMTCSTQLLILERHVSNMIVQEVTVHSLVFVVSSWVGTSESTASLRYTPLTLCWLFNYIFDVVYQYD